MRKKVTSELTLEGFENILTLILIMMEIIVNS